MAPARQFRQEPQATVNGITTRSPCSRAETPAPTSSTMPRFSWPNTAPGSAPARPSYAHRSAPQMHVEVIRTITSFGCSIRGSGTSSTATSKGLR